MPGNVSAARLVGQRYADALFALGREKNQIARIEQDLGNLQIAIAASDALQNLIDNPVFSRYAQEKAIADIGKKLALDKISQNFLAILAQNRRLPAFGAIHAAFTTILSEYRNELRVTVISAHPLQEQQRQKLTRILEEKYQKQIRINYEIDETLLGGMVVKIGNQMIDSSISAKLESLYRVMKGNGQ